MIQNGFILYPDRELLPDYKICPFSTLDISKNKHLPDSNYIDEYFQNRFNHSNYCYTSNGREAIALALKHFELTTKDCVTILTTTGNFYISSCVTKEIERFCKWSREINENTKLIFVNHEFGIPYDNLEELKSYNLPIIEDCAHSFFSQDAKGLTGKIGDFIVYSFPKMFPIQIGGLLVSNNGISIQNNIDNELLKYIKNCLSFHIKDASNIIQTRNKNYQYLTNKFKELNIFPRFSNSNNAIPGVFMFKSEIQIDYPELKLFMYKHGIQCSVFYGENAFFIPCHQNLTNIDLEYFFSVMKSFLNKYNLL